MKHLPTILAAAAGLSPTTTTPNVGSDGHWDAVIRLIAVLLAILLHILQARRERRRVSSRHRVVDFRDSEN